MKKALKIGSVLYFTLVFPILYFLCSFFILESSHKIYTYIPQDADIVLELNSKNFIREIIYQRVYNESYFLDRLPSDDDESLIDDVPQNNGIDFKSQILAFREIWAEEEIWYGVLKINDKIDFENYLESNNLELEKVYSDQYVILQLTSSKNSESVKEHLANIGSKSIKSLDSKIDLSEVFKPENEINLYISPNNSRDIIDGYLFLNFEEDKITVNGNFTSVGQDKKIPFITYALDNDVGFSLRSSLNIFNSIYLFNDQKLEDLPEYSQLSMNFDGTKMITSNATIPVDAYPLLNVQFDIGNSEIWKDYLVELDKANEVIVDSNSRQILLDSEVKSVINYSIDNSNFSLFQNSNQFEHSDKEHTYLELNINPNLFLDNTYFEEDSLNPPNMVASIKISVIQSIIKDMNYWKEIDHINFNITSADNQTDFLSNGLVQFKAKGGHSMIESILIAQNVIATFGAL
jgi:hypothetical protein